MLLAQDIYPSRYAGPSAAGFACSGTASPMARYLSAASVAITRTTENARTRPIDVRIASRLLF